MIERKNERKWLIGNAFKREKPSINGLELNLAVYSRLETESGSKGSILISLIRRSN
jgi:hypothetical protein